MDEKYFSGFFLAGARAWGKTRVDRSEQSDRILERPHVGLYTATVQHLSAVNGYNYFSFQHDDSIHSHRVKPMNIQWSSKHTGANHHLSPPIVRVVPAATFKRTLLTGTR